MNNTLNSLYEINTEPCIIRVPKMPVIMINGHGGPKTNPDFYKTLEILTELTKILRKKEALEEQFYAPIEMLWWMKQEPFCSKRIVQKEIFYWTAFIRQPSYVNYHTTNRAKKILQEKNPEYDVSKIKYQLFNEGICAQITHIGPHHETTNTINQLHKYIEEQGYLLNIGVRRKHHEIYLKKEGKNITMIIRHPIRKSRYKEPLTKV